MSGNSKQFNMIWSKLFFRSIAYIVIGLIVFVMGYGRSIIFMVLGGIVLAAGSFMMLICIVSFIKFLMGGR